MKRLAGLICLVILTATAAAHASDNSSLPDPGTTPTSPFFGLERAQETVSLALTFNRQKKVHKRLEIAEERLSEARKLAESNRSTGAEKALRMHSRAMENAERGLENLPDQERAEVSQELNNTRGKSLSVLEDLRQRLPEQAMKGIETAIQAHQNRGMPGRERPGNRSDSTSGEQGQQENRSTGQSSEPASDSESADTDGYTATGQVSNSS